MLLFNQVGFAVVSTLILVVTGQTVEECEGEMLGNMCVVEESESVEYSIPSNSQRLEDYQQAQQLLQQLERVAPVFLAGLVTYVSGKVNQQTPAGPLQPSDDQCDSLANVEVLVQNTVTTSQPRSRPRSRQNRRRGKVRRQQRGRAPGRPVAQQPLLPQITECREDCRVFTPVFIDEGGVRYYVVQDFPFIHGQKIRHCKCLNNHCTGKSGCGWWWKGTCVPDKSKRNLWVYYVDKTGQKKFKWHIVEYVPGCSCVPFGYKKRW